MGACVPAVVEFQLVQGWRQMVMKIRFPVESTFSDDEGSQLVASSLDLLQDCTWHRLIIVQEIEHVVEPCDFQRSDSATDRLEHCCRQCGYLLWRPRTNQVDLHAREQEFFVIHNRMQPYQQWNFNSWSLRFNELRKCWVIWKGS